MGGIGKEKGSSCLGMGAEKLRGDATLVLCLPPPNPLHAGDKLGEASGSGTGG